MTEPKWIRLEGVLLAHRKLIAEQDGTGGVRDEGLLDSALTKPENLYHYSEPKPTMAELAAAYAFGIVRNHPFVDGNKRTAVTVYGGFLILNRVELQAPEDEEYQTFLKLASGELTEKELALWISSHCQQ
ncbi:MAG: type II toxin-antitoxin system death-on-curing family toxin [Parvularculales bacterium]